MSQIVKIILNLKELEKVVMLIFIKLKIKQQKVMLQLKKLIKEDIMH